MNSNKRMFAMHGTGWLAWFRSFTDAENLQKSAKEENTKENSILNTSRRKKEQKKRIEDDVYLGCSYCKYNLVSRGKKQNQKLVSFPLC